MLLDVERGQPIEVEVIFGEVVRMAREREVDIPVGHFYGCGFDKDLIDLLKRVEMMYALLLVVQNQILCKLESN